MSEEWERIKNLYQPKKELSDIIISECSCGRFNINGIIYDPKIMPITYVNFTPKVIPFVCSLRCIERVYGISSKEINDLMHDGEVMRSKYEYKTLGLDNFTTGMW